MQHSLISKHGAASEENIFKDLNSILGTKQGVFNTQKKRIRNMEKLSWIKKYENMKIIEEDQII